MIDTLGDEVGVLLSL